MSTLREWIYTMLGKALLCGLLGQLRMCPICACYFVAVGKAAKRINCSDSCKWKRASDGAERVRRSRENKRNLLIGQARKMLKEGKFHSEIKRTVPLPPRVLEKVLNGFRAGRPHVKVTRRPRR